MNPIKDLISGGLKGIADSAANIIGKFKADPTKVAEAEASLKELQINAELESQRIANEAEKIKTEQVKIELEAQVKEMESARNMNSKIQESDHASWMAKNIAYCLDILFVVTFVVMLYLILNHQVPESNKELFYTGFGLLGGYVGTILNFHRGTSMGSEKKQKQLDKMINKG